MTARLPAGPHPTGTDTHTPCTRDCCAPERRRIAAEQARNRDVLRTALLQAHRDGWRVRAATRKTAAR